MEAFDPPKYLMSLIAAINDGAKTSQAGALVFTLIGLYLLASVFSTTDEDLVLQHAVLVSQIGVQIPILVSLCIAPVVFLAVHVFTLIRYDMLASNLCQFRLDLMMVRNKADQERCRQLLANVEFVHAFTAPAGSSLHSRLFRLVAWLILAVFPIVVLSAVQISSIRYQVDAVVRTQQLCLTLDFFLLFWFFYRQGNRVRLPSDTLSRFGSLSWILGNVGIVAILLLNFLYFNVPGPAAKTVRDGDDGPHWDVAFWQPLDLLICPQLHWGCRYLAIDHRTVLGQVRYDRSIVIERTASDDKTGPVPSIEGAFLSKRSLRFANFDEAQLYAVVLIRADLRHATLRQTMMPHAKLVVADLSYADLTNADLTGADLTNADLTHADLTFARLEGAKLTSAHLTGAILTGVHAAGADLTGADLTGVNLDGADLKNAQFRDATLVGVTLSDTDLSHADLTDADLTNADLSDARVREATFTRAILSNADLSSADMGEAQGQLDRACGTSTKLPLGLRIMPCP